MNSYYIYDEETQRGPYALGQIASMWNQGALTANAQYFDETAQEWKPLAGLLESTQPSSEIGVAPTIAPKENTKKSGGHPKEVTGPIEERTIPRESVHHIVVNTNIKQGAAIGGWVCLILGIVIMYFSLWTFILYVPLILVAFILSIVGMVQGRIFLGVTLLLLTIVAPPIEWLVLAATRGDKFAQKYIPGYTEERMIDKQLVEQATSAEQPTPPAVALSEQAPSPQQTPSPEQAAPANRPTAPEQTSSPQQTPLPEQAAPTDQPTVPEQTNSPQSTPTIAPSPQGQASQSTPPPFLSMEANTNDQIVPLTGLTAPIAYELKAPTPTKRESIAQAMLGYYYRDNTDEFSKQKFLQKLDSLIDKRVTEAKPSDLYSVDESVNLGEYNFDTKGFPTGNFNQDNIPLPDLANGSEQESRTYYYVRSTDPNQLKFVAIDPTDAESLAPGLSQSREATITYLGTLDKSEEEAQGGGTGVPDYCTKVIYLNVRKITITLSTTTESGETKLYQASEICGAQPPSNTANTNQTSQGESSDTGAPVAAEVVGAEGVGNQRLTASDISDWDANQVQIAIDSIYARHGVEFPNQQVQDWADKLPWYHRVPYKTPDMAEQEFSDVEKSNVEILAARRDALRDSPASVGGTNQAGVTSEVIGDQKGFLKPDGTLDGDKIGKYLTDSYQHCLHRAPENQREEIRIAQRAWIAYSNKTETALNGLGKAQEDVWRIELEECLARAREVEQFFDVTPKSIDELKSELDHAEGDLTSAYEESLSKLGETDKNNLIQAERAWVDFKEKNLKANAIVNPGGNGLLETISVVKDRESELHAAYQ